MPRAVARPPLPVGRSILSLFGRDVTLCDRFPGPCLGRAARAARLTRPQRGSRGRGSSAAGAARSRGRGSAAHAARPPAAAGYGASDGARPGCASRARSASALVSATAVPSIPAVPSAPAVPGTWLVPSASAYRHRPHRCLGRTECLAPDRRPAGTERLIGHGARPAHPRGRRLRAITELLRYPRGAAPAAEGAHRLRHGSPDLPGGGLRRALQCRHEHGVGPRGADAEVVHRWPHGGPPRKADTSTTSRGYDISAARRRALPVACGCLSSSQTARHGQTHRNRPTEPAAGNR